MKKIIGSLVLLFLAGAPVTAAPKLDFAALVVADPARPGPRDSRVRKVISALLDRMPVVDWDTEQSYDFGNMRSIAVIGRADRAAQAAASLIGQARRRKAALTIYFIEDGIYGEDKGGRLRSFSGEKVQIQFVSLDSLLTPAAAEVPSVLRASQAKRPWLGGLLESASRPGMWLGAGDNEFEGVDVAMEYGNGKIRRAAMRSRVEHLSLDGASQLGIPSDKMPSSLVDANYDDDGLTASGGLAVSMMGENHGVGAGILFGNDPVSSKTLLKAGYTNRLRGWGFTNELSGKIGFLSQDTKRGGSTFQEEGQTLYGVGDTLSYAVGFKRVSLIAEAGGKAVFSTLFGETALDHALAHGAVEASAALFGGLKLTANARRRELQVNTDGYFFADRRTDDQALAALSWSHKSLSAGVMGGAGRSTGSQSDDVQAKGGAWAGVGGTSLTGFVNRGQILEQVTVAISQEILAKYRVEAYYKGDRAVDGAYEKNFFGLAFNTTFGGRRSDIPDERRYRSSRDGLYAEKFYEDHGLSLKNQSARMDSVRKVNEWAGGNLRYVTGDANQWARYPNQTYEGRAGDCDEQAWLNSRMLNDNPLFVARGGKAHILDYWTAQAGHGVSLIEEGGKTFVNEYGRNYLVKVDPNASLEEKGRAALEQVGPFLALSPVGGNPVSYGVWGTDAKKAAGGYDPGYFTQENFQTKWMTIQNYNSAGLRRPIERGALTLIGLNDF